VIADPPLAGAVQVTTSCSAPAALVAAEGVGEETDGAAIVAGTVVIVIAEDADDAGESPESLLATTVNVGVAPESKPVTTIGEDDPVAVSPVEAVTSYDVAAGELAGNSKDTEAAPSLYGLSVPTFVAVTLIGANGSKKSFELCEFAPRFFPIAMLIFSYQFLSGCISEDKP